MPQHRTTQGNNTYTEVIQWLTTTLTDDLPNAVVLLGGDLQATHSPDHPSDKHTLELFCTIANLRPLGDPQTPTYTKANTPLDHWLLRLPAHTQDGAHLHSHVTSIKTTYNDHMALMATIPQMGEPPLPTANNQ